MIIALVHSFHRQQPAHPVSLLALITIVCLGCTFVMETMIAGIDQMKIQSYVVRITLFIDYNMIISLKLLCSGPRAMKTFTFKLS